MTHDERALLVIVAKALSISKSVPETWRHKISAIAAAVERAGNMASAGK